MNEPEIEINGNSTISEAIEILRRRVENVAHSEEATKFHTENPNWSNLFRKTYKPYQDALEQYEEALKVNEWLNGKNPSNGHLTIMEIFISMSDRERVNLFNRRINTSTPSIFDDYLKTWWINRY